MTVVAVTVLELELVLETPTVRALDACRAALAQRVAAVVPFATLHASNGSTARVIRAEVRSNGLAKPIVIVPRPREGR